MLLNCAHNFLKKQRWRLNNQITRKYSEQILSLYLVFAKKMPPKKKKGKGKKKKKKDGTLETVILQIFFLVNFDKSVGIVCISFFNFFLLEKTELTIEDKYKRTMQEIECLKDELGEFFVFHAVKMALRPQKKEKIT